MKIVIVGGGAAGIAAAYTILEASDEHEVHLFEATGKYGGRAKTDTSIKKFAFDMGAQYVQDPRVNPWKKIADDLEFELVEEESDAFIRMLNENGEWDDIAPSPQDIQTIITAIENSYNTAKSSDNKPVSKKYDLDNKDEILAQGLSPYGPFSESAEVWQYIAADRARVAEADEDGAWGKNLFVVGGLGTMIQTYGGKIASKYPDNFHQYLNTPIASIEYSDDGVVVKSENGRHRIEADACIVTVPTAVIASGGIEFEPELPKAFRDAFGILRLGSYKKLALKLRTIPDFIAENTNYYLAQEEPAGVWQYYRLGHYPDVLVVHTAGDFAAALDKMRDADVFELFITALREAYENEDAGIFFSGGKAITNWSNEPYAQGAYSYTAFVGGGKDDETALNARKQISKPLENTLYFAGEANSLGFYGTIAGAYEEGKKAAQDILGIED